MLNFVLRTLTELRTSAITWIWAPVDLESQPAWLSPFPEGKHV
jgi:hypothetical protein